MNKPKATPATKPLRYPALSIADNQKLERLRRAAMLEGAVLRAARRLANVRG
jgi:hypothetical protein